MTVATAAVAMLLGTSAVQAQVPEWAVGSWQGFLQNYPGKEGADRFMTVSAAGRCTWNSALASKPVAAKACSFEGETLSLLTTAKSQVKLRHKDGRLEGTFQTSGGNKSYLITLTRQ
jgi:hypothetical protein